MIDFIMSVVDAFMTYWPKLIDIMFTPVPDIFSWFFGALVFIFSLIPNFVAGDIFPLWLMDVLQTQHTWFDILFGGGFLAILYFRFIRWVIKTIT